jgi:plasmid segregation protein ParM
VIFEERPLLHSDFIGTPQFRALALGALSRMRTDQIDLLVTGLPVHLMQSHASRLKQLLTGYHPINESISVNVSEVKVIAQPLGGFISHAFSSPSFAPSKTKANLLIDPGYYTFDWLVARGLLEIPEFSGSVEAGVADYVKRVESSICRELNINYSNLLSTETGLRIGHFDLYGNPYDLTPHRQAGDEVVDRALTEMRSKVGTGEQIAGIFLVGGGATYFEQALNAVYPHHQITLMDEPVLANVRGFHLLAQRRAA